MDYLIKAIKEQNYMADNSYLELEFPSIARKMRLGSLANLEAVLDETAEAILESGDL